MQAIQATLAAAVLAASGLASAAPAFEGGQATGLTFEPQAAATQRDRADVAAEARVAARTLNSRSGQQTAAEATKNLRPIASTATRAQVRAEGAAAARASHRVFEGGQAA